MKKQSFSILIKRISIILSLLALVTSGVVGAVLAKFSTEKDASENASVSIFLVTSEVDSVGLKTDIGGNPVLELGGNTNIASASLPFTVTSKSEVSVAYSVSLELGSPLPSYCTVQITDGVTVKSFVCDGATSEFDFGVIGVIPPFDGAPSDPATEVELTFTVLISNTSLITSEVSIPSASLTVTADQSI